MLSTGGKDMSQEQVPAVEPFKVGKATIRIKTYTTVLSEECTFIMPYDPLDEFLTEVLAKRFLQIRSLVYTDPKNALRKLVSVNDVDISIDLESDVYGIKGIGLEKTKMYTWRTGSGAEILLVDWDSGKMLALFTTSNNNKYCVVIHRDHVARS